MLFRSNINLSNFIYIQNINSDNIIDINYDNPNTSCSSDNYPILINMSLQNNLLFNIKTQDIQSSFPFQGENL